MSLQQLGVARRHFETAVAGLRELRIETPDWVVCTTNLTSCLTDLAVIDGQTGQATAGVVRTDEAIELLSGLPKQDPTPLLFLSARGKVLTARASLRGTLDPGKNPAQLEQIAADFAEAIAAQSQVVDRGPTPKSYFRLSFAQTSYSLWLLGRRQFESAAKIARQAVVAGRQAFTLVPASESYCENLRTAFSVIASATVYQRDYAACEAAIREMIGLGVKGQRELHHVAVSLARAASLAGIDSTKKPQDRRATVNRLGDDAMDYLRRALAAGLSPVSVKRDPSFKILHRRADWHELTQQK
jgi:endonuclease YncB( thermonuclease family)